MPQVKMNSRGLALLHVWREGEEYYRQKSPVFNKEFTNVLYSVLPSHPDSNIIHHDLKTPLQFESNSFDAVNAYHVLEHLSLKQGEFFTREVFRVLKPGGIFRLSTPDLELIAREYLEYLEKALHDPTPVNLSRYHWTVLEMIDQATRDYSGGLMLEFLRDSKTDKEFIKKRYSDVFDPFFEERSQREKKETPAVVPVAPQGASGKLKKFSPGNILRVLKRTKILMDFKWQYRAKAKKMGSDPRKTLEAVKWMHDRLSLRLMVEKAGFGQVKQVDFNISDIPFWKEYDLDQSNYGKYAIDPSVYIECKKSNDKD